MLTITELNNVLKEVVHILDLVNKGRLSGGVVKGIDTLSIRKMGLEEDISIDSKIKEQVLSYLEDTVDKSHRAYTLMKTFIDESEMSSSYYRCYYPKQFRGAYKPVILKTIAAMMLSELSRMPKSEAS